MQAVILAGGVGSRLGQFTKGRPKCLLQLGGKALIQHQLEALADHGVGPVLVVLGYRADDVRRVVGDAAEYIVNERYEETNSLYSLSLAREWIKGTFLLLNCDLLFDPEILSRLLEESGSVLAFDSTSSNGHEQTKVAIRERRVLDLGKDVPAGASRGESLGLLKFDAEGAKALFESVDALIRGGHEKSWVTEAVRTTCSSARIYAVNVAGLPWVEVDFPYDYERARREVWPAISKSRSRPALFWRRTRWAAAAAVALALGAVGWFSSVQVGPASVDWESVSPVGGEPATLVLPDGAQRWWIVRRGERLTGEIAGADAARFEFRLLLPPGTAARGRYVVEVSVDGEPTDWKVFSATPDSIAVFSGFVVGDRDRITLDYLPPDARSVAVTLVAGTSDRMLARIRRPE